MFVKAIRFRDVLPGDVVCEEIGGELFEIEKVEGPRDETYPKIILWIKGRDLANLIGDANEIIGLVHRAWPRGGKWAYSEHGDHMIAAIMDAAEGSGRFWRESPDALREAIEAYELGKPLTT